MDFEALGTLFGKVSESASNAYFRVKEGDALKGQQRGVDGEYYTLGQFGSAPNQQSGGEWYLFADRPCRATLRFSEGLSMAAEVVAAANPWLGAASIFGSALGSGLGGSAGPSSADAIFGTNLNFDNSGWNVAFSGSDISSQAEKTSNQGADGTTGSNSLTQYLPYAVLLVAAIVAIKLFKK